MSRAHLKQLAGALELAVETKSQEVVATVMEIIPNSGDYMEAMVGHCLRTRDIPMLEFLCRNRETNPEGDCKQRLFLEYPQRDTVTPETKQERYAMILLLTDHKAVIRSSAEAPIPFPTLI